MTTIIVEIPHQGKVLAWVAESDSAIINAAGLLHNMTHSEWTYDAAVECWGEDDLPTELLSLLEENAIVIETGSGDGENVNYQTPSNAPTEIEFAKEVIASDLSGCFFLSLEEANDFNPMCHQAIQAKIAVREALEEINATS